MYAFGSSMKGSARAKSTSCQSKLIQNVNSSFQSTAMMNNNKRLSPQREIAFWISYLVFRRSIALLSSQIIPLSCVSLDILEHRSPCSPFWTVLRGFYNNGNNGSLSAAFRFKYTIYGPLYEVPIECFHMTSRRPYWCPKTMKRRPCWCPKPILWEFNSFLMQMLSVVPINLHRCWAREWKHSIATSTIRFTTNWKVRV